MTVRISFCVRGNYRPRAASLAAAIERETGAATELVEGDRGQFDVEADGRLLLSKWKQHRFPDEDEIIRALAERE